MKTTDYIVVSTSDSRELGKEVKKRLDEGWQLHGGMVALSIVLPPPGGAAMRAPQILREFHQAMIKAE